MDALRALGCDIAQGFHYARPMPAGQLSELLADAVTIHTIEGPVTTASRGAAPPVAPGSVTR